LTRSVSAPKGLVLVVEDERAIADLERMYLSREGFGVHVEHDGDAGLAAAQRLRPVAIVLDVGLPGIDGTEAMRRIRAHPAGRELPVVAVTAFAMPEDRELVSSAGFDGYIEKPISTRALPEVVRRYV